LGNTRELRSITYEVGLHKKQQLVAGTYLQMKKELGVIKYSSRKAIESISDICEQELSKPKDTGTGINWLSLPITTGIYYEKLQSSQAQ